MQNNRNYLKNKLLQKKKIENAEKKIKTTETI